MNDGDSKKSSTFTRTKTVFIEKVGHIECS